MTKPVPVKVCTICNTKKSLTNFGKTGRRRKKDGVIPYRAACKVCMKKKARERWNQIARNKAIRKCPTCDNAMASNGTGSQAGLRENRARLHSEELLQVVLGIRSMIEHLPEPHHPLLSSLANQAAIVLTKVMGRPWAKKEEANRIEHRKDWEAQHKSISGAGQYRYGHKKEIYEKQRHRLLI